MSPRRLLIIVSALLLLGLAACKKETKLKVTDMSPMNGDFGGERVTFKGHGFATGGKREIEVFFGDKKAHVLRVEGDDTIIVDAPGGEVNQEVEVLIIFEPGGEITLPKKFKYVKHEAADVGDLNTGGK